MKFYLLTPCNLCNLLSCKLLYCLYYKLFCGLQGCRACDCQLASESLQCDDISGQCRCKPGVVGRNCDRCASGYWQYTSTGCISMKILLLFQKFSYLTVKLKHVHCTVLCSIGDHYIVTPCTNYRFTVLNFIQPCLTQCFLTKNLCLIGWKRSSLMICSHAKTFDNYLSLVLWMSNYFDFSKNLII